MPRIRPMPLLRGALLATCSGLALAIAAARADAATVSATYQYTLNSGPVFSDSASDGSVVDLLPSDYVGNSNIFGHHYAYDNGNFGTRSSGSGTYAKSGTASWSSTFTNSGTMAVALSAAFLIDAGDVSVSLFGTGTVTAGVLGEIKVDGNTLFATSVAMESVDGGTATLATTGTALPVNSQALTTGYGFYGWDQYLSTIDLGLVDPGQTVTIDYILASYATSSIAICEGGGYGYGGEGYGGYGGYGSCDSASSMGRIGDPVQLSAANHFVLTASEVATPEPASAAVLGAGLAALAFRRRRAAQA